MNNKVKVSKFWLMGGVCRIELWPDLPYMLGKPWLLGACSRKEFLDVSSQITDISVEGEIKYRIRSDSSNLVRSVRFLLDGFFYEYRGNVWGLMDDDYLYIKERIFK